MNYYSQKQFVAKVDNNDHILGKIERWQAHQKAILHRGFTMILMYKNQYLLQHRKHPAYDGYFDLTFSSHQIYIKDKLQDDLTAIYQALKREWNLDKKDLLTPPEYLGNIYYKASDPKSIYTEHEIDHIYKAEIKSFPSPNLEFCYGFSRVKKDKILSKKPLAPWAKKMIDGKVI